MFERFTERARQVVVLAQEECRLLGHDAIGLPHLLLGLLREEEGLGARALVDLGITYASLRSQMVMNDEPSPEGQIPFTPDAKRALELSLREALGLGHNYIGTEHVLLGIVRLGNDGWFTPIALDDIRAKVLDLLYGPRKSKVEDVEVAEDEETIDWPCQHEPNSTYGRLVCALYLLLRDHVRAGDLEQVLLNSANALDEETGYTNPYLEKLAKAHAGFLLEART